MITVSKTIPLNSGGKIPSLGLGIWQMRGEEAVQAVLWALEAGYRHIDTAKIYGNEAEVGRAIKESGIPREEIFITTKLWNDDQGYDSALRAIDESLERLDTDYVDLYLIHWPYEGRGAEKVRKESWEAMEETNSLGKAQAIGVSNYEEEHIEEIKSFMKVLPAVNQIEQHPFLFQKELSEYCKKEGIVVENYSPLDRGKNLNDPSVSEIAEKYGKTNAQILLRWGLEHGSVVIPKSSHKERILENMDIFDFEITEKDMQTLDSLGN